MEREGLKIKFLKETAGEWFDLSQKEIVQGKIYAYKVGDTASGEWLLNVFICEKSGKAVVTAISSEKATYLHDQIKRKSIVFIGCKNDNRYYHPLGIGCVQGQRFHYERVDDLDNVPVSIKNNFDLDYYESVSPITPSKTYKGKIVAIIEKDKPEKMALLFALEKIRPVFL
jgi:hypothetical protein